MIALQIIFWISLGLIVYSYLLFPEILRQLAAKRESTYARFSDSELPNISILMAAFNEEEVIARKIQSILDSDYAGDKVEILVGSDASTDATNQILRELKKTHPSLQVFFYEERKGKPGIINELAEKAKGEILLISDADVLLDRDTLKELCCLFKDERTGLVDSRMVNTSKDGHGIARQEKYYIGREGNIKHREGIIWGAMMGPFGGCYALRKSLYQKVPDRFLVDDFFINMMVLKQGFHCISNLKAFAYEQASSDPGEEFRRKKRISAGNFQNLCRFWPMLFFSRTGIAFCFFSHKVLRWLVPFLVLFTLGSSLVLGTSFGMNNSWYLALALFQVLVLISPLIDHILRIIKIQSIPLRFVSHFVMMNLALLAGFLRYLGGIKKNVWQPTSRKQD
jgi:cellulose synthase/poly-beta-1,6-N-acetylglucosamine synthase-like glycosyltransferase